MKSCQDLEQLLDDFVDDETTPDERREVEQHLAGCSDCRSVVKDTRALLAASATLAREVPPGEDLWPDIRARIGQARSATASPWSGARTRWLGLAASLLVVALAGSTTLWLRQSGRTPSVDGQPAGTALPADYDPSATIEDQMREYVEAAELLQASIRERGTKLSPETLVVVEKNLAIIDQAIAEVRGVLESDPTDRGNALMLQAMHQQKVELLRRVSRLSS